MPSASLFLASEALCLYPSSHANILLHYILTTYKTGSCCKMCSIMSESQFGPINGNSLRKRRANKITNYQISLCKFFAKYGTVQLVIQRA